MKFLATVATLAGILTLTVAAQVHAQEACHAFDTLIGQWEWHQVPESDTGSHGTFSFQRELNGKARLLRLEWTLDKSKPPRRQLIVIYENGQRKEKSATYFDEYGTASSCSVENTKPLCGLTINCDSVLPPQYSFMIEAGDKLSLAVNGRLASWFRARASRVAPNGPLKP